MMRFLSFVFIYLLTIALGLLCIALIMERTSYEQCRMYAEQFFQNPYWLVWTGLFGFLCFFSILFAWFGKLFSGKTYSLKHFRLKNANGEVILSIKTVEDFILQISRDLVEVKEMKPHVVVSNKNKMSIRIYLKLWSGSNVLKTTENLQSEIRKQIQGALGIENIEKIDIEISEISGKRDSTKKPDKTDVIKTNKDFKELGERILEGNEA